MIAPNTLWLPKINCAKNQTSWKRRRCVFTKANERDGEKLLDQLELVYTLLEIDDIFGNEDEDHYELLEIQDDLEQKLLECYYFPAEFYKKLKPYTQVKQCTTYESMLEAVGCHGHAQVVDKFGFTGPQLHILANLLFDSELDLRREKRGVMNKFEATLLVCAKLRLSLSKVQEIGRLFGRDPSAVSAFTRLAVDVIVSRFGYLIRFENMNRFADKAGEWNAAFRRKFTQNSGRALPGRYAATNCIMDGLRMYITVPSVAPDIFFNPMLGSSANIVFLLVTGANGLILGVSEAKPGSDQDAKLAFDSQVQTHLANANLVALCDAIFPHTNNIKPLLSQDQIGLYDAADRAALSQIRIAVEWSIGEVKEKFQYFRMHTRQKVLQTRPAALFRAAVLLQNCHRCFEGCNANSYFDTDRPTIQAYLVPEEH